ncbi:telomere binding protein [Coemansia sp. RSA 486]|nr:telomere binding protein [Coemansia sp. RSA 486]
MSFKQSARSLFSALETRVSQLTASSDKQPLQGSSQKTAPLDSEIQSLEIGDKQETGDHHQITVTIPGLSGRSAAATVNRPLITPINDQPRKLSSITIVEERVSLSADGLIDELKCILQAPLAILGVLDKALLAEAADSGYQWAQDAVKLVADNPNVDHKAVAQLLAPWFARSVIGDASYMLLQNLSLADSLIEPYFTAVADSVSWPLLVSTVGVLASNKNPGSGLSLCVHIIQLCLNNGILDPQRHVAAVWWPEYLAIACSVPERVANRVDPRDVPQELRPAEYFVRLANNALAIDEGSSMDGKMRDLWSKLCRLGHAHTLGAAITTMLIDDSRSCVATAARKLSSLAGVYRERLVGEVVSQLDASLTSSDDPGLLGRRAAAAIGWTVHSLVDAGCDKDDVVRWLVAKQPRSLATNGAVALALMALSGSDRAADAGQDWLAQVPSRVYPSLLADALTRVLIPLWSFGEFLQRASMAEMKAATALVLVCAGALSDKECRDVAASVEFMQAVPRFLDSPIAVVKLSGIVVADQITKRGCNGEENDKLDFGLEDVFSNARQSQNQVLLASARYVEQLQSYAGSPLNLWKQQHEDDGQSSQLDAPPIAAVEPALKNDAQARVVAPRQASLTDGGASTELQSGFVRPRKPTFLGDCIRYMRETKDGGNELVSLGLFASAECIDRAGDKALREHWPALANRVLYAYNRGSDDMDMLWNDERRRVLAKLAVRLPELVGPFLADRSCDRNLTLKDREIVYSAISSACIELSEIDDKTGRFEEIDSKKSEQKGGVSGFDGALGAGTVVRRSRRLDLVAQEHARHRKQLESSVPKNNSRKYLSIVGPAFFFPLVSQYGKSDCLPDTVSDVRRDVGQLEKLINTLGIILFTAGSATHMIAMNREFWDLAKLVRRQLGDDQPLPVVDAVLFGIDVILDPQRALSVPTLAREFRNDIADMLRWIDALAEKDLLRGPALAHAARVVDRLREIQEQVGKRVLSNDFGQFSSII